VVAVVAIAAGAARAQPSGAACSGRLLPEKVRDLISRKFPSWKFVTLSDLDPDDRKLWLEARGPKLCPGIAVGHFENPRTLSYAVLLIRRERGKLYDTLIVASMGRRGKWRLQVLSEKGLVPGSLVVYRMPPGEYFDFYDNTIKVRAKLDVIWYEYIEAAVTMYYWSHGRYRTLQVSD
jgi:hypothetical protein